MTRRELHGTEDGDYYDKVAELLEKKNWKQGFKSVLLRVRTFGIGRVDEPNWTQFIMA